MFLRINDTILELSGAKITLGPGQVELTVPLGKYAFTGEAAEALRSYFDTLPEVVHLDKLFTQRELVPEKPIPIDNNSPLRRHARPTIPDLPIFPPERCPLKKYHPEHAIPCPACGQKPGQVASEEPGGTQTTSET